MTTDVDAGPVTERLIPEVERLAFLPRYLGTLAVVGEGMVFDAMRELSDTYRGGSWAFYGLSNGGFYMAPQIDGPVRVVCAGNFYDGEMSAQAAGIVACLFALNRLAWRAKSDHVCRVYEQLLEYARDHPEASAIGAAID